MLNNRVPVAIVAAVALFAGFFSQAAAARNPVTLDVNGRELTPDVPPQIINDRVMVPIQWVAESLGATVAWDRNVVYISNEERPIPKEKVAALIRSQGRRSREYYIEGLSYDMADLDADGDLEIVARIDGGVHLGQFFIFDKDSAGDYRLAAEQDWKVETCGLDDPVEIAGKKVFGTVTRTGGTGLDVFIVHLWYLERGKFVEAWQGTLEERSMMAGPESFRLRVGGYRVDIESRRLYAWETLHQLDQDGVSPKGEIRTTTTIHSFNGVRFVENVEGFKPGTIYSHDSSGEQVVSHDAGHSCSLDKEGNVIISYNSGETTVKAPLTRPDTNDYAGEAEPGVYISERKTAIAYGGQYRAPVYVLISDDMGKTWPTSDMVVEGVGVSWQCIGFTSEDDGWLVVCNFHGMGSEDHFIYKTSDGGKTWTEVVGNANDVYAGVLTGAGFSSDKTGFLGFRYETDFQPAVCWTQDGGLTWEKLYVTLPEEFDEYSKTPLSPVFYGANGFFPILLSKDGASNVVGTIYLTSDDYGNTWRYDGAYDDFGNDSSTGGPRKRPVLF